MTSVGLRSCATKERWSSHRNCVHQLAPQMPPIRWHSEPCHSHTGSHTYRVSKSGTEIHKENFC